jgi:protein O-GlcNAcase / histone acetyltransferase
MTDGPSVAPGAPDAGFLSGVIEGFYGPPWSASERCELFDWMTAFGLDTYLYAPKDDLKHRALWREAYSASEAEVLAALVRACAERGLRFVYGLSPGLDIRYSDGTDRACLRARTEQMLALGCGHFGLLFDDIPDRMRAEDEARWPSFASAQCEVANSAFTWIRERRPHARFLFCPTPYCGRMAERGLGGEGYLDVVGRELDPGIDVCWTGPEIVSREIAVSHVRGLQRVLRRKPLIWDNLHANDYDGGRFYCGPYAGRPAELRQEVAGVLVNPNGEFPLNFVPLRTFGEFVCGKGPWDARRAYLAAMAAWLPRLRTVGPPITLDDLILLGDCYYLPYEAGPTAADVLDSARQLMASDPAGWGEAAAAFEARAARLRDVCARVSALRDRALFHALSRRTWELREELELLLACVRLRRENAHAPWRSDFHLPGTYRGGMVAQLRRLLVPQPDGTFVPAYGATRSGPDQGRSSAT